LTLPLWAGEGDANYGPVKSSEGSVLQWVKRFGHMRFPGEFERGHGTVLDAFRGAVAHPSRSTVRVVCDGTQTAMGVVVRADGWILTKASELTGSQIECLCGDGSRLPAKKVAERDEFDLALLRVAKHDLPTAKWSKSPVPTVGSWLITTGVDPAPLAIGVVSTPLQPSPSPRPVLGVRMHQADRGVRVNVVLPGTGAARAGIRQGDVIAKINGQSTESPETVTDLIRRLQPGDKVTLSVFRDEESLSLIATLGDMTRQGGLEQAELMDSLGGPLSRRRAGFPTVIQHDSVIRPRECGGPIVDIDGNVVGVNIARASRVSTLALPVETVRQAVSEMISEFAQRPVTEERVVTAP
jgi:serine protease Do